MEEREGKRRQGKARIEDGWMDGWKDACTTVTLPNKGQVSTGDHPPPGMLKKS